MTAVPVCIGNLYTLSDLNMAKNKLKGVPQDSLVNLKNLTMLDLHQNHFEQFWSVPKSSKLDTLNLGFNRLEVIENLENAPNLTVLDLYNNKIKVLPICVYKMQELKTLGIANNDLSDLDPYLGSMVNLVRISIEGNPLRSLKPAIREAGAAQLKKYLQQRQTDEQI